MELAADSISVKVSEAIMHMQENSVSISTKARNGAKADEGERKEGNWTLVHYCFSRRTGWLFFCHLNHWL